jgi:RNase P protein component
MAKTKAKADDKMNKSSAVREVLAQNPKATSKDVVTLLGQRGIKVTPTLVYYIKSKAMQAKRMKRRTDAAAVSESIKVKNPVELVIRVKQLAQEVGGMSNLKQLVDLLVD